MKSRCCKAVIGSLALALLLSTPALAKAIDWSGYTWNVRTGDNGGPGPNRWSADNVSVDDKGRLHLKIAKQGDKWSCAELTMNKSLGFGTYTFDVDGSIGKLNDNVVLGFFNYPTPDIGPDGTNEIDIEFATWGGAQKVHGNWTVWPAVGGIQQSSHQFSVDDELPSRNSFIWMPNKVTFLRWPDKPAANVIGAESLQRSIPQHPLPVHINLWLFNGKPPTDDKEVEIIVSAFRFTPQMAK